MVLKYYISTNRKVRIIVLFTICTILGVPFKESSVMTEGEFSTRSEKFCCVLATVTLLSLYQFSFGDFVCALSDALMVTFLGDA